MIEGLEPKEREFIIWALGFVEGAAGAAHVEHIGKIAAGILEKFQASESFTATVTGQPVDIEVDEALDDDMGGEWPSELRYVELSWKNPAGQTWFTCTFVESLKPKHALDAAKKLLAIQHPEATEVEEWLQRKVSAKTAERIRRRMEAGDWNGWLSHGSLTKKDDEN